MKSPTDIEKLLEHFRNAWPDHASLVDRVMWEVNTTPTRLAVFSTKRILIRSIFALTASLVVCITLWWAFDGNHNSLYAQVIDAARKARTIHIVRYGLVGKEAPPTKTTETWYEKGVGFRRDVCAGPPKGHRSATICLGRGDDVWTLDKERKNTVIHSQRGITKETEQIFADFDRSAKELRNNSRRYPDGDQTFGGQRCKAYVRLNLNLSKSGTWRELFYLDQQSRLVRFVRQSREGDRWNTTQFNTIAYDEPFDSALFQPNFGKDFKVVDADADTKLVKPERVNPEGPVLIYEIDERSRSADTATVDLDRLLRAVDGRLNGGSHRLAAIRRLDDRRIEVAMLHRSDAERKRVERQLTRPGTLEFRLLANHRTDASLINLAQKEPSKAVIRGPAGKRLAWWVPVKISETKSFVRPDVVRRTRKQGNRDILEVLVVADPYNINGNFLSEVKLHFDPFRELGVSFKLNEAGGKLFNKLTGDHLPNNSIGLYYKLGIIIDGELYSAPSIQSKIGNTGEITGSFTEIEASDLVAVLNAGNLLSQLRLVEEHQ
ncbi:MAG: hypothetical protein ABFC54_03360 [Thermoguttaceae bacterium]